MSYVDRLEDQLAGLEMDSDNLERKLDQTRKDLKGSIEARNQLAEMLKDSEKRLTEALDYIQELES